ncbi:DUF6090 family protein [Winogradskyella sp. PG-2]|uniref:DUF6090 family protein n=1 Tax=Winogradskyella sp. PG-2 TaxID=754409 RepID=UPI001184EAAF|nr:DUF6090 family protein [Winogradskyella sp. PG-2]
MIKFFRKIRQSLLMENKTGKYFKYAIGEIILVVIGILIALQINNWNANKANEKQAYNQLLEVQKEVLNNIVAFDETGTYYFQKLSDVRRVFSDTLTIEDYQKSRTLRNIMTTSRTILTQNEAFNKLAENADNLPDQYKPLVVELKNLYNHSRFEKSLANLGMLDIKYFDFISEFSESMYREDYDAFYQFMLTNKGYKNKLARFSWTLDDLALALVDKKYNAITVYNQMVGLGFPNNDNGILKTMFQEVTPKVAESFVGNYTNTIDTISIDYNNKEFLGYYSKFKSSNQLNMKDATTLNFVGAYLEFNDDKSEFYFLMEANKPVFKRIPEND